MDEQLLTAQDCMDRLQVSRTTFYDLVKQGTLPAPIKLGRCSRWRPSEVEAAIEATRVPKHAHPVRKRVRAAA